MTTAEQIAACTTLDQLLAVMTAMSHDDYDTVDITNLPVFGGTEPHNTLGVWSWDAEHLIVGTCSSDFEIVSRDWLTQ